MKRYALSNKRFTNAMTGALILVAVAIVSYIAATHFIMQDTFTVPDSSTNPSPNQTAGTPSNRSSSATPTRIDCPSDRPPLLLNIGGQPVQICGQPTVGTVVTITDSSITVATDNPGGKVTFAISADTALTEHGQTIDIGDVHVSDPVSILPSDTDARVAKRLLLNFKVQSSTRD